MTIAKTVRLSDEHTARLDQLVRHRPSQQARLSFRRESDALVAAFAFGIRDLEQLTLGWRWRCDRCGDVIRTVEDGWVNWISHGGAADETNTSLMLVHHRPRCRLDEDAAFRDREGLVSDLPLSSYLGHDGLMEVVDLAGRAWDKDGVVYELLKRLFVPGYEQVRKHASAAEASGGFEPNAAPGILSRSDIIAIARWMVESGTSSDDGAYALALLSED